MLRWLLGRGVVLQRSWLGHRAVQVFRAQGLAEVLAGEVAPALFLERCWGKTIQRKASYRIYRSVYIYIYLLICERQGKKSGFWEDLVFIWMFCFFSLLWGYSGPFYMVSTLRPVSSKSKGISPRGLGDCTFLNSSKA